MLFFELCRWQNNWDRNASEAVRMSAYRFPVQALFSFALRKGKHGVSTCRSERPAFSQSLFGLRKPSKLLRPIHSFPNLPIYPVLPSAESKARPSVPAPPSVNFYKNININSAFHTRMIFITIFVLPNDSLCAIL